MEAVTKHENAGRRLYVDILEVAARLERNYGHYFKPYTGEQLYLEFIAQPALDFKKHSYYQLVEKDPLNPGTLEQRAVKEQKDLQYADVYDQNDRVVLRSRNIQQLKAEPSDPVRMMEFIRDYITDYCHYRIPVFEKQGQGLDKIFEEYLSTEFLEDFETLKKKAPAEAEHFVGEVFYLIDPLLSTIREFMGPNKWTIFLVRRVMFDLVVDGYVDYRIYDYHERLKAEADAKCQDS